MSYERTLRNDVDPVATPQAGPAADAAAARAIGQAVRCIRRQRAWSIERLAERADISYQYVSEIETGKRNFSIMVLERLAAALEVTIVGIVDVAYRPSAAATAAGAESPDGRRPPVPRAA